MRKFLLILPLLSVISLAQAEDELSAQVISYGISPAGICETFPDAFIPSDHRRVPSCDDVEEENARPSLAERLRARFHGKTRITHQKREETISGKERRLRRGPATRRDFVPASETDEEPAVGVTRRSTAKNFQSIFRRHNVKGGFNRGQKVTGHKDARIRPLIRTRSTEDKNTNQKFTTEAKWSSAIKDHFRQKNFGTNPYNISSVRSAQQRAFRAQRKNNSRVDVNGRIISNQLRWRPGRLEGNLDGDLSFREAEVRQDAEVQATLDE